MKRGAAMAETPQRLKLEEFIYQVKRELLEAQSKHADEASYFELETMELEVKVGTTLSGKGSAKVDLWVISLGEVTGTVERESLHTIKLKFNVLDDDPLADSPDAQSSAPASSSSGGGGLLRRRRKNRKRFAKK